MPQRFHVTPTRESRSSRHSCLLLLWLIKLRCRTWATRLYCIGLLIAAFAIPFALAGQTSFPAFGALVASGGLVLALWGIVLDTRQAKLDADGATATSGEIHRIRTRLLESILSPGLLAAGLLVAVCALWSAEHYGCARYRRDEALRVGRF